MAYHFLKLGRKLRNKGSSILPRWLLVEGNVVDVAGLPFQMLTIPSAERTEDEKMVILTQSGVEKCPGAE